MYCIHCGKWVEGEADTCPDCAAAQSAPVAAPAPSAPAYTAPVYAAPAAPVYPPQAEQEAPVYTAPVYTPQPPVYTAPVYPAGQEDTFRINTPEVPKKSGGKKVVLLCVLAAIAAIAVLAVVFWDNITGLFGKSYDTPAEHLQSVEEQAMTDSIDTLTDAYGQLLSATETKKTSETAEMHLLLGDDMLELLEAALEQEGIPLSVDWLSDIMLTGTVNANKDIYQVTMGLGLGNTTLLTTDIIADIARDEMWMGFPELNKDYLFIDSITSLTGVSLSEMLATSQVATQELAEALPAPEVLNGLMKKYGALVLSCLQNVEEGTQTVTQGDFTQEFTTFTAQIHFQDAATMAEALLTELKDDTQAQDLLIQLAMFESNASGYYVSESELREELLDGIDEALEDIAESKNDPDMDDGSYLEYIVYLDSDDRICGRSLAACSSAYREEILEYILISDGDNFSLDAVLAEVTVTGTGTNRKGQLSGDFTLIADGLDMFHVQLIDIAEGSGKVRLYPSRYLLESILDEAGISGSGIISNTNVALEVEMRDEKASEYVSLQLLMNEELLVGFTVTTRQTAASDVRLPSGGVDVMDDEAGMQWLMNMDFTVLMENMAVAGVPSEIIQIIEYLAMSISSGMIY